MAAIPPFEADGLLPPGDYEVSFDELRQSILVVGPGGAARSPTWDFEWRAKLVDNLEILTRQLWQVGITEVFADGSFAEDKDHPNDIDGALQGLSPFSGKILASRAFSLQRDEWTNGRIGEARLLILRPAIPVCYHASAT